MFIYELFHGPKDRPEKLSSPVRELVSALLRGQKQFLDESLPQKFVQSV